jgi:hypothetical protein
MPFTVTPGVGDGDGVGDGLGVGVADVAGPLGRGTGDSAFRLQAVAMAAGTPASSARAPRRGIRRSVSRLEGFGLRLTTAIVRVAGPVMAFRN